MNRNYRKNNSWLSTYAAMALLVFTFSALATTPSFGQQTPNPKLIRPIEGSRVIAGNGPVHDSIVNGFVTLCGKSSPDIVVVCLSGTPKISAERWKQQGVNSVQIIDSIPDQSDQLVLSLLNATGVWFESEAKQLRTHALFPALLHNLVERGGVVGGVGVGAMEITGGTNIDSPDKNNPSGFGLLPRSTVKFESLENESGKTSNDNGDIQWYVPESSALVFHHGRQVTALGTGNSGARLSTKNGWKERTTIIDSNDAFDLGDVPAYDLDLLSWLRSSTERQGPVFPAKEAPKTFVESGTLILHGGSGVDADTFKRFIKAAGGKNAAFVCIPSASNFDAGNDPDSYSAERLQDLGCDNVTILHASDPITADQDARFLETLENAQGIWIDGGRTYRMMDRFENTKSVELMRKVLERDGVIGGSSAGCQVAGDFLVRGNPRTNRELVYEGYTRGFGFIEGVILDAHFLQRGRGKTFQPLMEQYPQMLGIGVDENTAILIRGSVAEVLGSNAVSFYDMTTGDSPKPVILKSGAKYELQKRKQIK